MYSRKVQDFVKACGELKEYPRFFLREQIDFLKKMVDDEFKELQDAQNETEQADALVDIIYYVVHAAVKNGYNLDPIFNIVHEANMKKIVNGKAIRREDGKILKPMGWVSPDPFIDKEIKKQINKKINRKTPFSKKET